MKRLSMVLFTVMLMTLSVSAQDAFPRYGNPLDPPLYLSATFGEFRANHPHAGIDIKTGGVEGKKVYAVADGYISRIGVSPYGYGNVLYVTHNDGYTSVYGHLQRFSPAVAAYVKAYQYAHKTFSAQIYPDATKFKVKQGDIIAYSGDSGGSGGPHLHFEIRTSGSEKPVNPMYFGYKIADDVKPNIIGLSVYPLDKSTVEKSSEPMYFHVSETNGRFGISDKKYICANGTVAFGICTYDIVGTQNNKDGAFQYELYVDDLLRYKVECDSFSYGEQRYVNSLIDYRHYKEKGSYYLRTEVDPYNKLKMIEMRNGTVSVEEGDTVSVMFKIKDFMGNTSIAAFTVVGCAPVPVAEKVLSRSQYQVKADGSLNSDINIDDFSVKMESGTFFRDEWVQTGATDMKGCCSRLYRFGDDKMAVFKPFTVRIRPNDTKVASKMYIAYLDDKGEVSSLGGKMVNGWMETTTRSLGRYAVKIDSVAPKITPQNFKDGQAVTSLKSLRFKISDDMTGIDSYNIYINDNWVLGKFDAKNALLYYDFDEYIKKGSNRIKVVVKDNVSNSKTYKATVTM